MPSFGGSLRRHNISVLLSIAKTRFGLTFCGVVVFLFCNTNGTSAKILGTAKTGNEINSPASSNAVERLSHILSLLNSFVNIFSQNCNYYNLIF